MNPSHVREIQAAFATPLSARKAKPKKLTLAIVADNSLSKAGVTKPPAGYSSIPNSKHRGFRKRKGRGWIYWYPTEHKHGDHHDWEADYGKTGISDIKAGQFVSIQGRHGLFVWTPDAADDDGKYTHVTTFDPEHGRAAGEPIRVRSSKLQPMKGKAKPKAPVKPRRTAPRRPPPKKRAGTPGGKLPPGRAITEPIKQGSGDHPVSEEAERSKVFADSRAKAGTFLHKVENGHYPLATFVDRERGLRAKKSQGIFIPKADQAGMLQEFKGLLHSASRKVAASHAIDMRDSDGNESPDFEEIKSGANLGFLMALRGYSGGKPFAMIAQDYVNTYASYAARSALGGGGPSVPHQTMRLMHGYIAAKHRASRKTDEEPTKKAIARAWRLQKRDTFTGRAATLGVYHNDVGKVVDQATEEVPFDGWQVRAPDGKELGKELPGKDRLISTLDRVLDGHRVLDSEWMNQNPHEVAGPHTDPDFPVGTQLHLRREIDDILSDMEQVGKPGSDERKIGHQNARAIELLFGLTPDAEPGEGRRQLSGNVVMSNEELAERLGIAKKGHSARHKRGLGAQARSAATEMFQRVAHEKGAEARLHAQKWIEAGAPGQFFGTEESPGPSYRELFARFGADKQAIASAKKQIEQLRSKRDTAKDDNQDQLSSRIAVLTGHVEGLEHERVRIYAAGVRAGRGDRVGKILKREKSGKASAAEKREVRQLYHEQRDRERLSEFLRYGRTRSVGSDEVETIPTGSDPESSWLYADEVMRGYMQALLKRGSDPTTWRGPSFGGESKVMSPARFQQFTGRVPMPDPASAAGRKAAQRYRAELSGAARRVPTKEEAASQGDDNG
jgi:hypothetical protein